MTATLLEHASSGRVEADPISDDSEQPRWRKAWLLCGACLVALLGVSVTNWWLVHWSGVDRAAAIDAQPPLEYIFRYVSLEYYGNAVGFGGLLVVSCLVLWLDRRNKFGWFMWSGVVLWMISNLAFVVFATTVDRNPSSSLVPILAWIGVAPMMVFPLMLSTSIGFFPHGRIVAQGWWRRVLTGLLVFGFVTVVGARFLPGPIETDPTDPAFAADNPLGFDAARHIFSLQLSVLGLIAITIFSLGSLLTTYVRSGPEGRHQIKWVVALIPLIAAGGVAISVIDSPWETVPAGVGILLFAGAFAVAITKRNLYAIDAIISRSVVYTSLAGFIGLVYVSVVVGVGSLIDTEDGSHTVLSVAATAIVAVAFQPIRQRLEHFANLVVFGRKATPYEVLSTFAHRVAVTSDDLLDDVARSLTEGTRAERVVISVIDDNDAVDVAAWPPEPTHPTPDTVSFPIADGETQLGALTLHLAPGQLLPEQDTRLASNLASGMGLTLRNQLLTEHLEARIDDLRRSRRRLVALQDDTRRQIERDLHDGAQQQLVALKLKLGLGKAIATKEGAPHTAATLDELANQADHAVDAMRTFARGVYPPLLEAEGLTAAIGAHARRAPIPVTTTCNDISRLPREIESTIYFCVLEALKNTIRHANATHATINLTQPDGTITFEINDNGQGFDPTTPHRTGLTAITDRLDALTGTLHIDTEPGHGTTLTGTLPITRGNEGT